jgi:phosphate-selective porin
MRILLILLVFANSAFAKDWGISLHKKDTEYKLKIGGRLQGAIALSDKTDNTQDIYMRRMRFNVEYKPKKAHKIYMDIRNDKTNKGDVGEVAFTLGDAYWQYTINDTLKLKAFRAKIDVSYSQTTSSKNLLNTERAAISNHASNFISQSRRGSNLQLNGLAGKLQYQVVFGDGAQSGDLKDVGGSAVTSIVAQKFFYGAKLRYHFFNSDKKHKNKDTTYGKGRALSLGVGYFTQNKLKITYNAGANTTSLKRQLTNIELKLNLGKFSLLAEVFNFKDDLIDLTTSTFGKSGGHAVSAELFVTNNLKHALYFKNEDFERNSDGAIDSYYQSNGVGYNWYIDEESLRFGVYMEDIKENQNISQDADKKFTLYTMMNY